MYMIGFVFDVELEGFVLVGLLVFVFQMILSGKIKAALIA